MSDLITMMSAAAGAGGEDTDPFFNQTTLLLHGDGTNGAQNNTFLDSSTNNFTITRVGNTTQGTFSPFSLPNGEWTNYFSGSWLTVPSGADFNLSTNSFCIEFWLNPISADAFGSILTFDDADYPINFEYASFTSSNLRANFGSASAWYFNTFFDTSTATNVWAHYAVTRSGSTFRLFKNGILKAVETNAGAIGDSASNLRINANATASGTTYISNLRIINGSIPTDYQTSSTTIDATIFSVPTAPLTTTSQGATSGDVKLLTCQSNRFVDNSPSANTVSVGSGTPSVQPFSPFLPSAAYSTSVNGGSGYFDGTGDYLSIADAAGLRFGTGNFTIQCWIYRNAAGAVHSIAAKGGASTGWVFQVHSDNKLRFTHTTTNIDSTGTIPASSWTHVAVVREGTGTNQVKLYINGVNDGQGTVSTNFNQTEQLNIGADRGNSNVMNGYIAGWKYVVGTAETITVPTAPPIGGTALLNFTNAGIFDNTGKNNLETVGDAQIDTTTKKYGTGSMEFDGNGDYLLPPNSANFAFGTGDFTIEAWIYDNPTGSFHYIYDSRTSTNDTAGLTIVARDAGTTGRLIVYSNGFVIIGTHPESVFYHMALVRSGSDLKLFVNGTQTGSTATFTNNLTNTNLKIGAGQANDYFMNGYIDDLRITKGVARYTANFSVPTKAFPDL